MHVRVTPAAKLYALSPFSTSLVPDRFCYMTVQVGFNLALGETETYHLSTVGFIPLRIRGEKQKFPHAAVRGIQI